MLKKILLVVLATVLATMLLAVFAAVIFVWQFDLDDYRGDLEAVITQHTGLDVAVAGGLTLVRSPELVVGASDIIIKSRAQELASLKNIDITLLWEPLWDRELVVDAIKIGTVDIKLRQDAQGNLVLPEFPAPESDAVKTSASPPGLPLRELVVNHIEIENLTLSIEQTGDQSVEVARIENLDFVLKNLLVADNATLLIHEWPAYLDRAALVSTLKIGLLGYAGHELRDVVLAASHNGRNIHYDLQLTAYGGRAVGKGQIDWHEDAIDTRSELKVEALQLGQILQALEVEQQAEGALDLVLSASNRVSGAGSWLQNLQADAELKGEDLLVDGFDIDQLITKLVESQKLNLKDLGGFAVAGPLALLVTKGTSYGGIVQGALGGETHIPVLNAKWQLANQKIGFQDVAFTTEKTRAAVKGHIDLEQLVFGPLEFDVLNSKGCSLLKRKLNGSLAEPELGAVEFAASSILNPLLSIVEQGQGLLIECKPVYEGIVAHPEKEVAADSIPQQSAPDELKSE